MARGASGHPAPVVRHRAPQPDLWSLPGSGHVPMVDDPAGVVAAISGVTATA